MVKPAYNFSYHIWKTLLWLTCEAKAKKWKPKILKQQRLTNEEIAAIKEQQQWASWRIEGEDKHCFLIGSKPGGGPQVHSVPSRAVGKLYKTALMSAHLQPANWDVTILPKEFLLSDG